MELFYKIWVDAIAFEESKSSNRGKWKVFVMSYMTIMVAINIATIYSILFLVGLDISTPVMEWLSSFLRIEDIKGLVWSFLMIFTPSFLINYFLIFHNKRYENLILKYDNKETKKGRLSRIYFFVSFLLFFGISLINKLLI